MTIELEDLPLEHDSVSIGTWAQGIFVAFPKLLYREVGGLHVLHIPDAQADALLESLRKSIKTFRASVL